MKNTIDIKKYYKRSIDVQLYNWYKNTDNKTIALVSGARRIGKTYSLRFLGQTEFKRYEIIDVQQLEKRVVNRLKNKGTNINYFIEYLLLNFGISESEINEDLLIIFDEIQEHGELKEAISLFNSYFKCRFACTGSALWIDDTYGTRPTADYEKFFVYPFSFEQFLTIIGDGYDLFENEKEEFDRRIEKSGNKKLLKLLRLYMVVGGMPQPIQHYLDNMNKDDVFASLQECKKIAIITTYKNDLVRYSKDLKLRLLDTYSDIVRDIGRYRQIEEVMPVYKKLEEMNLVIIARNLLNVNRKLSLSVDKSFAKPFLLDIGVLFYYLCDNSNSLVVQSYCKTFVDGKDTDDNGFIYENFVASTLIQHGYNPYFKLFDASNIEGEEKTYELDFVFSGSKETIAIESKSGKDKEHKSLELGLVKFNKIKSSYILCKSYKFDKKNSQRGPHYIPFYALVFLLEK